jgi:hypothetical protein
MQGQPSHSRNTPSVDEGLSNLQTVRGIDGQHGNGDLTDRGTAEQS